MSVLKQKDQIRPSKTYDSSYKSTGFGSSLQNESTNLEDDLNAIRTQVRRIIGNNNWFDSPLLNLTNGVSLDLAYDFTGNGAGRTITADNGALQINAISEGNNALELTGTISSLAANGHIPITPNGTGQAYIGTGTPVGSTIFNVFGTMRISGGNPAPFRVLTANNSNGTATWQDVTTIPGVVNAATLTDIAANSQNSLDSQYNMTAGIPVQFLSSSASPVFFLRETDQFVGIGTNSAPAITERLSVNGAIRIGAAADIEDGTIQYTGTDFEGRRNGAWISMMAIGAQVFTELGDTPSLYTGDQGKILVVNTDEDAIEFITGISGTRTEGPFYFDPNGSTSYSVRDALIANDPNITYIAGSLLVYLNGQLLNKGTDYIENANLFDFTLLVAPGGLDSAPNSDISRGILAFTNQQNGGFSTGDAITQPASGATATVIDGIDVTDTNSGQIEVEGISGVFNGIDNITVSTIRGTNSALLLQGGDRLTVVFKNTIIVGVPTENTFIELDDTPVTFAGSGSQFLRVNAAQTAVEFFNFTFGAGIDNRITRWDQITGIQSSNVSINDTGDLVPTLATQDLGSDGIRWQDLFLGPGTLHIGTGSADEVEISYNTTSNYASIQSDGQISLNPSGGNVGVGTTVASGKFHIFTTSASISASSIMNDLVIENSTSCGFSILTGTSQVAGIAFGDSDNNNIGMIRYQNSGDFLEIFTNGSQQLIIDSNGDLNLLTNNIQIGAGTNTADGSIRYTVGGEFEGRHGGIWKTLSDPTANVTVNEVSGNSTNAAASIYLATNTIPVEFRTSSGSVPMLYMENNGSTYSIGIGTNNPNGSELHIFDSISPVVSFGTSTQRTDTGIVSSGDVYSINDNTNSVELLKITRDVTGHKWSFRGGESNQETNPVFRFIGTGSGTNSDSTDFPDLAIGLDISGTAITDGMILGGISFRGVGAASGSGVGAVIRAAAANTWQSDGGSNIQRASSLHFLTKDIATGGGDSSALIEAMMIDENQRIGIGTNVMGEKLVINGAILMGNAAGGSPVSGTIYFDGNDIFGVKAGTPFSLTDAGGSGTVSGTGTANRIPRWLNTTDIKDSIVSINDAGDILPTISTQSLGSNTNRWQDLFLSASTLHIGTNTTGTDELQISYNTSSNMASFIGPQGILFGNNPSLPVNIGIGTTSANVELRIAKDSISPIVTISSAINQANFSSTIELARSRGTHASKLVNNDNDQIGMIVFKSYSSQSLNYQPSAAILSFVDGTPGLGVPGELVFETGNTGASLDPRMIIRNNGDIGINTLSPSARLQVENASVTSAYSTVSNAIVGIGTSLGVTGGEGVLIGAVNNIGSYFQSLDGTAAGDIVFNPSGGNVGIGRTSVAAKFHVALDTGSTPASANTAALFSNTFVSSNRCEISILSGNTSGVSALNFGDLNDENVGNIEYNNSSNSMSITTNQVERLVIGDTANLSILNIKTSGSNAAIKIEDASPTGNPYMTFFQGNAIHSKIMAKELGKELQIVSSANGNIGFWIGTNPNENLKMSILTSGNVGIGTAAPAQLLSVAGVVESTIGGFKFPDQTVQTTAAIGGDPSYSSSTLSPDNAVYANDSGFVGIGSTNASAFLHVNMDGGAVPSPAADVGLIVNNSSLPGDDASISIISGTTGDSGINFGDTSDEDGGRIFYTKPGSIGSIVLNTNGVSMASFNTSTSMTLPTGSSGQAIAITSGSSSTSWISIDHTNATGRIGYLNTGNRLLFTNTSGMEFRPNDTGGGTALQIEPNGNVGIGRFPSANVLEVEGDASKTSAATWLANSDRRIKKEIEDVSVALSIIGKLSPVQFKYTDDYRSKHPSIRDRTYFNFIAQEYEQVFPDNVQGSGEILDGEEILQIDTHPTNIYAVAAIKELHTIVKEQAKTIDNLKLRLELLEA